MEEKEKCGCKCGCEEHETEEKDEECSCGSEKCSCGDDDSNKCSCGGNDEDKCGDEACKCENTEEAPSPEEIESERYMRLMAEFQNYKRRSENEKSDIYARANEKVVTDLLTVADNFERALQSGTEANEGFVKGMKMIFKQLQDVMTKAGAAEIKALGEDFDPNFHNAVMMEDSEEYESGKVSAVLQKGYTLNGRVIRPSMVKVAN